MSLSFYIETYGCQMNKAESLALCAQMIQIGYQKVPTPQQATWVIINTCSVRQTAEDKVIGRLGLFKTLKKKHPFKVAVMGCMGERIKEVLAKTYEVDAIIGNFNKKLFLQRLKEDRDTPDTQVSAATTYPFKPSTDKKNGIVTYGVLAEKYDFFHHHAPFTKSTAFVPIMHGCNHFCTFCIVPYVRGREISRAPDAIIAELQKHVDQGVKEITLLGQNVNSYHHEKTDFAQLLSLISTQLKGDVWIRFLSSHPKDFAPQLLDVLNSDTRFAHHLHLAVQHANSRLLKEMNRQHTKEEFVALIAQIREKWPHVSISTDLMIGFPSESEEEFEELLDFLDIIQFDDAFTYQYNDREGTIASRRADKVDEAIKKERIQKMIAKQRTISSTKLQSKVGTRLRVLVEAPARQDGDQLYGRSEYNNNVVFPFAENLIGEFVEVEILEAKGQTLYGRLI